MVLRYWLWWRCEELCRGSATLQPCSGTGACSCSEQLGHHVSWGPCCCAGHSRLTGWGRVCRAGTCDFCFFECFGGRRYRAKITGKTGNSYKTLEQNWAPILLECFVRIEKQNHFFCFSGFYIDAMFKITGFFHTYITSSLIKNSCACPHEMCEWHWSEKSVDVAAGDAAIARDVRGRV
jgi:hypothetical protein